MSAARSKLLLDAAAVEQAIAAMAQALVAKSHDQPWAVVGIRRGGEPLAYRLAAKIEHYTQTKVPVGFVDITLYRDDGFGPHDWPVVGTTSVGFDLPQHTVVLVDDVLYTGRTVRAALDAILDYGRPKAVRLAVLVDRGLRELPIAADAAGITLSTAAAEHVTVHLAPQPSADDNALVEPISQESTGESTGDQAQKRGPV